MSPAVANPVAAPASASFKAPFFSNWQQYNRSMSVEVGGLYQDYTEYDAYGFTTDGILNAERGSMPSGAIELRLQDEVGHVPLWLQVRTQRSEGQTRYQGYIQSGSVFIPYRARTGNRVQSTSVRLGIPFGAYKDIQLIPAVEIAQHRWNRDLVQYEEAFSHRSYSLGIIGQWRVAPQWNLEGGLLSGRTNKNKLDILALGFSSDLPSRRVDQFHMAVNYFITPPWSVGAHWHLKQYHCGASPVVNNLQYPDSKTQQQILSLRLSYKY